MENMSNIESELAQNVVEFYNTTSKVRRMELQKSLDQFMEGHHVWRVAMSLVIPSKPTNVQFYGAKVLHHSISLHFDQIAENTEDVAVLKDFYTQNLTDGAGSLPHSVLNKLSSGLAVLMLRSLPDIWSHPIRDLILLWSNQLELLLRVLAEIAAEFNRLIVPSVDQRNAVKSELNSMEINVIQISQHVLEDADSSASMRNAAIECIELWLKLPGAKLDDYAGAFNAIFVTIGNDFPALARILTTIRSIEGFQCMPKLIWQITQFIACGVCPRVQAELSALIEQAQQPQLLEGMDELVPLVSAMAEFGQGFMSSIIALVSSNIANQNVTDVFISLSQFFFNISTLPGIYPVDECLSDLPELWWCSLREQLLLSDEGPVWSAGKLRLRAESLKWYTEMLRSAIGKFTYDSARVKRLDKETLERFESYRTERNDVSLNAVQMEPEETIKILAHDLEQALDMFDPNRCEAILRLTNEAADFIKVSHMPPLLSALRKSGPVVDHWISNGVSSYDDGLHRFVRALLALLQTIDHLLNSLPEGRALIPHIVHTVLSCLRLMDFTASTQQGIDELALGTLTVMMKNRDSAIRDRSDVIDAIIQKCYEHFSQENRHANGRLAAIRCVGIALSFKQSEFVLNSLNEILAPRLVELNKLASNSALSEQQENNVLFELGILAQLVATLEPTHLNDGYQHAGVASASFPVSDSPVRLIIDLTLPLFNKLLENNGTPSAELISMLCDVLKSTVHSLYRRSAPLVETMLNFLDVIINVHPRPACELAKTLFLTFHKDRDETSLKLVAHLARWFSDRWAHFQQLHTFNAIDAGDKDEQLLSLAYHVLKKFWDNLRYVSALMTDQTTTENVGCCFVRCHCLVISLMLQHSKNVSLVHDCLRSVNHLLRQSASIDDCPTLCSTIGSVADQLTGALFASIRSELITGDINLVADILHALARKYPTQTRATISALPGGDSQLITTMLSNPNARTFRLRCAQMHQAALLQRVPTN
uniref:Exportin-1/Importin-beta-like domain-containing protein n=1 Tax=Globodera rostochiensis TaxID=31243 RepID=A0A914GRU2_GLORO